jgi:putative ABC transport system permease protein
LYYYVIESFKIALRSLRANKMRSALTMLGVIIGVGAVITMISIAQGAKEQAIENIRSLGTNILTIFPGQQRVGMVRAGMGTSQTLKFEDAQAIAKEIPYVTRVAPEVTRMAQVKYQNQNTNTRIVGTSPDYPLVRNFRVEEGDFFTDRDVRAMRKVCVIGKTTASNLFGNSSPINKVIKINGINFRVIGLMASKGAAMFGDPDDQIFIPITTMMKKVYQIERVNMIGVEVADRKLMEVASAEIESLLRRRHKIGQNSESDFVIRSQEEIIETAESVSKVFTMLLGGIASVSLIVGGIGIMNIMLVSVTERTREIGIRKAVGARRRDILVQFLIEALALSLIGGVIGILLGVIGSKVVGGIAGWRTAVSIQSIIIAFSFAAAVGIFFGIYPARKASSLDPAEALRYE